MVSRQKKGEGSKGISHIYPKYIIGVSRSIGNNCNSHVIVNSKSPDTGILSFLNLSDPLDCLVIRTSSGSTIDKSSCSTPDRYISFVVPIGATRDRYIILVV